MRFRDLATGSRPVELRDIGFESGSEVRAEGHRPKLAPE